MTHISGEYPLGVGANLALLEQRGLQCDDRAEAVRVLQHLDPQLFAEYCALLEEGDPSAPRFRAGASFAGVLELYRFDSALRVLLFDAIQIVELSLRRQWVYHPSMAHGSLFYKEPRHFRAPSKGASGREWHHGAALDRLYQAYWWQHGAHEGGALAGLPHPPARAVADVMSLGQLSRWCTNLKERGLRERIAYSYGLNEALLRSFLPSLVGLRNICAHHGRLYGKKPRALPKIPKKLPELRESFAGEGHGGAYSILVFLAFSLKRIDGEEHGRFVEGLRLLFARYGGAEPRRLGFPSRWWSLPVWRP